ncbi:hypothetical protein LFAB_16615 [Lactiplantibacillus fabifermentans T30PCM01]|uniref:Uncharacterized protein n=2 Tax=Lactiplantibacillus fabifermentans TaxID=483011 RepID=A0A0R2NUB6_9LACO|nr:hypothetical protein LFAB_16615 [Lactiplantibacillus fabifermentans T30PCM01]KRO28000.1 hypothetical protein DY78_GL002736 [Lactiplantibacillus fabifermentans DSM 21115]
MNGCQFINLITIGDPGALFRAIHNCKAWQQTETRATGNLSPQETQLFLKLAQQVTRNLTDN